MEEAAVFQMPYQMRQSFAFICVFANPANALALWDKFKSHMALDYLTNRCNDEAFNMALHDINYVLQQHAFQCFNFNRPQPIGNRIERNPFNAAVEQETDNLQISTLNPLQKIAFEKVLRAIDNYDIPERYFFLDGPGGSGKTIRL